MCLNNRYLPKIFCLLLMLFGQFPAQAQVGNDTAGATDHALLQRFPESRIISYSQASNVNYRLVTGNLRRTAGQVVPSSDQRLIGNLTRITYEVSRAFTGADVYDFYVRQLQDKGVEVLFTCSGRGCGNSNYWANDVFEDRILYGPERDQFYIAARAMKSPASQSYASLYINTRTNGSLYVRLDVLDVGSGADASSIEAAPSALEVLRQQKVLRLADLVFSDGDELASDSDLSTALAVLRADAQTHVYVVVHLSDSNNNNNNNSSVEELTRRSQLRADAIKDRLSELGIESERLGAFGVGPLAPVCSTGSCSDRIELVLP